MNDVNQEKKSLLNNFFRNLFNKGENDSINNKCSKLKILLIVVLFIVIIVIFASSFKTKEKIKNVENETTLSSMEYCAVVENRLCNVLRQIKGIGNVDVFIMVDSSPTIKYLEETKTEVNEKDQDKTSSIETTIVLAKNGSITNPVVVVELLPEITGVLVVATGAKDIKVKNMLINAVSAILDVKVSNVEVLEGK